jgi:spoIIIJ-associated protein
MGASGQMSETARFAEATGSDEEAAIQAGLEELGVERDRVRIEVLEEARAGVMGLGAREARVRLTVEPASETAEVAQRTVESVTLGSGGLDGADTARQVLTELLAHLGITEPRIDTRLAEPAPGEDEPPIVLDISGPGTSALIGHHGSTLAALQHITRLMTGQALSRHIHLVLDVDGFKARREETLQRMAERIAQQAIQDAETVVLEPMPAHERRVIHLALRDDPQVTTESIGEGDRRRVSIIPRN